MKIYFIVQMHKKTKKKEVLDLIELESTELETIAKTLTSADHDHSYTVESREVIDNACLGCAHNRN